MALAVRQLRLQALCQSVQEELEGKLGCSHQGLSAAARAAKRSGLLERRLCNKAVALDQCQHWLRHLTHENFVKWMTVFDVGSELQQQAVVACGGQQQVSEIAKDDASAKASAKAACHIDNVKAKTSHERDTSEPKEQQAPPWPSWAAALTDDRNLAGAKSSADDVARDPFNTKAKVSYEIVKGFDPLRADADDKEAAFEAGGTFDNVNAKIHDADSLDAKALQHEDANAGLDGKAKEVFEGRDVQSMIDWFENVGGSASHGATASSCGSSIQKPTVKPQTHNADRGQECRQDPTAKEQVVASDFDCEEAMAIARGLSDEAKASIRAKLNL